MRKLQGIIFWSRQNTQDFDAGHSRIAIYPSSLGAHGFGGGWGYGYGSASGAGYGDGHPTGYNVGQDE